jgi:hypothetical protein
VSSDIDKSLDDLRTLIKSWCHYKLSYPNHDFSAYHNVSEFISARV